MIQQVGKIMLYVEDQEKTKEFWVEKVGFSVVEDQTQDIIRWIEITPTQDAQTHFVLHNKTIIAELEPELILGTPSLLFFTQNIEELYTEFKEKGITVGELVSTPTGRGFNFADYEEQYFAVVEEKR